MVTRVGNGWAVAARPVIGLVFSLRTYSSRLVNMRPSVRDAYRPQTQKGDRQKGKVWPRPI